MERRSFLKRTAAILAVPFLGLFPGWRRASSGVVKREVDSTDICTIGGVAVSWLPPWPKSELMDG